MHFFFYVFYEVTHLVAFVEQALVAVHCPLVLLYDIKVIKLEQM